MLLQVEDRLNLDGDRRRWLWQKVIKGVSRPSCLSDWEDEATITGIGRLGWVAAEAFRPHWVRAGTRQKQVAMSFRQLGLWIGRWSQRPAGFSYLPRGARGTSGSAWEELIGRSKKGPLRNLYHLGIWWGREDEQSFVLKAEEKYHEDIGSDDFLGLFQNQYYMVLLNKCSKCIKDPQIIWGFQNLGKYFSKIQEHRNVSENAKLFKLHEHQFLALKMGIATFWGCSEDL